MSADIEKINYLAKEINQAASEQNRGVSEISKAMNNLSSTTQSNVLSARQSGNLAITMESQSTDLVESMASLEETIVGVGKAGSTDIDVNEFSWSDDYLVHVPDMDGDHKVIIDKIGILVENINGGDHQDILTSYRDLVNFSVDHFTREEKFMLEIGHKELESHKKIHVDLVNTLTDFDKKLESSADLNICLKLVSFLYNWLVGHIKGIDNKYGEYYNSKNKNDFAA